MPTIHLEERAPEEGTFGIRCDFVEKAPSGDVPFTPKSPILWSLMNDKGQPVNGKTNVQITSPAESITIVLKGADLALAGSSAIRYVFVEGTYDGTLGTNLTVVKEVSFQINNLKGKP
jgi:hypothetical protein